MVNNLTKAGKIPAPCSAPSIHHALPPPPVPLPLACNCHAKLLGRWSSFFTRFIADCIRISRHFFAARERGFQLQVTVAVEVFIRRRHAAASKIATKGAVSAKTIAAPAASETIATSAASETNATSAASTTTTAAAAEEEPRCSGIVKAQPKLEFQCHRSCESQERKRIPNSGGCVSRACRASHPSPQVGSPFSFEFPRSDAAHVAPPPFPPRPHPTPRAV
jgi:hypothetical protein